MQIYQAKSTTISSQTTRQTQITASSSTLTQTPTNTVRNARTSQSTQAFGKTTIQKSKDVSCRLPMHQASRGWAVSILSLSQTNNVTITRHRFDSPITPHDVAECSSKIFPMSGKRKEGRSKAKQREKKRKGSRYAMLFRMPHRQSWLHAEFPGSRVERVVVSYFASPCTFFTSSATGLNSG